MRKQFPGDEGGDTYLGEYYQTEDWFLLECRDEVFLSSRKLFFKPNSVLAVRTREDRAGLGKMWLLRLLLFCSCLFLRIQATSGSWRISLPIFVWLYENAQSTVCRWKLCQTNRRSPSFRVKMSAETHKSREPGGLELWKQKQQSLGNFLQE